MPPSSAHYVIHGAKNLLDLLFFTHFGTFSFTFHLNKRPLQHCVYPAKRSDWVLVLPDIHLVLVVYQDDEEIKSLNSKTASSSELPKPVQDLVRMIFDVESMKKAMLEFEVGDNLTFNPGVCVL